MTMLLAGAPALLALPQKVIHRRTGRVEGRRTAASFSSPELVASR